MERNPRIESRKNRLEEKISSGVTLFEEAWLDDVEEEVGCVDAIVDDLTQQVQLIGAAQWPAVVEWPAPDVDIVGRR